MKLFVFCTSLLLFSIQCLYGFRPPVEELSVNDNRNALECLQTLISIRYWATHDFSIIFDGMDIVDFNFFQRFPNICWKLHTVRNNNLTGLSNVIFFTSDFDSFVETMKKIDIRRMDGRAKFVISVAKNFANLDEIKIASKGVSAVMWKLDKIHVVYLVSCKKDVFAMTYFPFAKNCQVGELEILDVWNGNDFVKGTELFPEKMLDIRGCVQNHSVIFSRNELLVLPEERTETGERILGGVGGRLITMVANKMNMKLHTTTMPRESWRQLITQVRQGESIFSLTANIPLAGQTEFLDLDFGYMEESFGLGYIVGDLEVSCKNIIWPLSNEVWQCIGFTGLIFCGLLFMANRCHRGESTSDTFSILNGFGIFLGTTQVLPRSYFGRYLFGMWIVYSYLMSVAYNSGLVSYLTTPNENRVIETLQDLLADGIDFGGEEFHREFYHDPTDTVMMKVYNNFKIWTDEEGHQRLMNGQAATGLFNSFVFLHNSNETGSQRLHMMKEKAFSFQVPIFMRRGSPFTPGVRRYTSRAIQGGFNVYWLQYYTYKSSLKGTQVNTPTRISMQHIKGILYLYIAVITLSCVVFLGELMFYKYSQNHALRKKSG